MGRKFMRTPFSLLDIAALEGFLEEKANDGLFPYWICADFAWFQGGGVAGTRFRVEPVNGAKEPAPEQLELYRNLGWTYADTISTLYFLYYTTDQTAPELHTDPVTQSFTLEALVKAMKKVQGRRSFILLLPLLSLMGIALLYPNMVYVRLPLYLLDFSGIFLIFLVSFSYFWVVESKHYRTLAHLHQRLSQGIPIARTPKRPRGHNLLCVLVALLTIVAVVLNIKSNRQYPLEEARVPYVSLAQLEQQPLSTFEEMLGRPPSSSPENNVRYFFSFLSPRYYAVEQVGYSQIPGRKSNYFSSSGDPEFTYAPQLDATYYHLLIPPLARSVAYAKMDEYRPINLDWVFAELQYPGTDLVIFARAEDDVGQLMAVIRGGRVAVYSYLGQENLTQHLDVLSTLVR